MPNIEIHGFDEKEAEKLREDIFALFQGNSYFDDMVVTIYPNTVKNRDRHDQPFVRLVKSSETQSQEMIEQLHLLGIDVEYLRLEKFIPKNKGG